MATPIEGGGFGNRASTKRGRTGRPGLRWIRCPWVSAGPDRSNSFHRDGIPMGDDLAGICLLIRGRHDLYVSSLAALLKSRGATVRLSPPGSELPDRRPRATRLVLLESPLP